MIIIHGVLTLTSPLHTSAGTKGMKLQRDGRAAYKENEGIPIISNVTSPICIRGRYHGDLPIFPSNGLVGRLRRMGASRLRSAICEDEKKISQALYYALMNGHQVGPQLGAHYTLADYERVQQDIFFGLFGGGSLRHAASYIQSDLIPVTGLTIDAGLVPQKFADLAPTGAGRDLEPWQLFDYRVIRKVDDVLRGRDSAASVDLSEGDEKREAAVAYQTIPVGTSMYWRSVLQQKTTLAQRGLFLLALRDLFEAQQLGGRTHLGWGGFTAQRFRMIDGDTREDLFECSQNDEGVTIIEASSSFEAAVEPALAAMADMKDQPAAARQALLALLGVD